MDATAADRAHIRETLGDLYDQARWPDAAAAAEAESVRGSLLTRLRAAGVRETASGSKLHTGTLSRSCQACVDGTWSCIYITNWCQADCFYCPQSVESRRGQADYAPVSGGMAFPDAQGYADYVIACGFDAVGVSGGEPLSALDLVADYVTAVKERSDHQIYVHVYTNGLLATRERLTRLRDIGVDEIRFDITARDYDLSGVELAREILPTVTVEIPAIPEDETRLAQVIRDLAGLGVDHLNLHQINVTPDNAPALIERGYTFLHQPLVVALESELTALRTLEGALADRLDLPINYCCPNYKTRFQRRARMARAARLVRRPPEEVTTPGFLRVLTLRDEPRRIADLVARLRRRGHTGDQLRLDDDGALSLTLAALLDVDPGEASLTPTYHSVELTTGDHADDSDGDGDQWAVVPGLPAARLWARRKLAAEARLSTPAVRDAYVEMLAHGWDEKRAFLRVQTSAATTAQELKAALSDWSRVRQLRAGEVTESGLGVIG